jgi:ATP-dependent RNA helicase MSS116
MFGAFRRCPAVLSKSISRVAVSSSTLRTPLTLTSTPAALRIPLSRSANASIASFHSSSKWQQVAQEVQAEEAIAEEGPATTFSELASRGLVHRNIVDTITRQMKIETMTDVQQRTINEALSGVDMYGTTPFHIADMH